MTNRPDDFPDIATIIENQDIQIYDQNGNIAYDQNGNPIIRKGVNVIKPPNEISLKGFRFREVLNRNWLNWILRTTSLWIRYIDERLNKPETYTIATLPNAVGQASKMIYISDESGGSVIAFSDGANWRRLTDRNIVS